MNSAIIQLDPNKELPVIGVKIIEEKYADGFVNKGIIHFSNPDVWRDSKQCSGLQLDKDEGCFCKSILINDGIYKNKGRHFKRTFEDGVWKYFENTKNIVGCCFYGVLKNSLEIMEMQYGVKTIHAHNYTVPYKYFQSFRNNYSTDNKKTIIILDLWKFCDLIVNKSMELGALREDIYISTVYYVNKQVPFCTAEKFPFEFFLKDDSFSSQSELRIIIASKNNKFYKRLKENDNNLILGDISSFSVVQDKYEDDLDFSIQGDKLLYKLATPETLSLEQRSFKELVGELYQILQNQLPGVPKGQKELEILAKPIIDFLEDKYGVSYKDDWRLYNVPYNEYTTLSDLYKGMCATIIK